MLATVLAVLTNFAHYLDDIIQWVKTQSEHDAAFAEILQQLNQPGLQLNRDQCQFNKFSLRFKVKQLHHRVLNLLLKCNHAKFFSPSGGKISGKINSYRIVVETLRSYIR